MKKLIYLLLAIGISFASCTKDEDDSGNNDCQFTGNWSGTYDGDETGTIYAVISNCNVSADVIPTGSPDSFQANGSVTNSGNFSATVGSVSSGAVFEGQLSGNSGSGTWTNLSENWTGSWEISKQ